MNEPSDASVSDPSQASIGRRRFLAVVSTAAIAGSGVAGCSNGTTNESCTSPGAPAPADSGVTVGQLAVGALACAASGDYFLARDSAGVYAYSSMCTHECCLLPCPTSSTEQITCGCHNSVFNANGDVVTGPAPTGLDHYAVTFQGAGTGARIFVDPHTVVTDRAHREPPP